MRRLNKLFVVLFVLLAYGFLTIPVRAQESTVAPSGPSDADVQAAQNQAGQAAQESASGEEASMRAQFENQFGAPPEAFQKHEPQKPQFEQPQRVPDEAKKYLSDAELLPIYCAMTRWKTGQFFGAMNALKNNMLPAMEKAKEKLGIELPLPNIDKMIEEGRGKINSVCSAKTLTEAEDTVMSFAEMGQNIDQNEIGIFMAEFEKKMQAKGNEIKTKIEALVNPLVEEEKAKIQPELEKDAQAYVKANITIDHQPSADEIAQIRAQVENYLKPKIEAKKQEITQKIQARVNEIKDKEVGDIESIGKLFEGMDQKINSESEKGLEEYDQYKKEAFRLRKEAVFKMLDKNLDEGLKKLDEADKDIEGARKDDPSIKSVGQIKSEITQDRKNLEARLDSAMEAGDENAFQQALNDFKTKWESARAEGEKAAEQSMDKACNIALAQFGKAKGQMTSNLAKINNIQNKCDNSATDECLKINEFSDKFSTLTGKINDIQSAMNTAESMCANPDKNDRANMIALMRKIQRDGEDLKIYGEALDAEKSKAIADSASKICAQALPQIEAAKTEINNNDLLVLQSNLNRCVGKNTEECGIVNQLAPKFNEFKKEAGDFSKQIALAENFCKNPKEGDMEKIAVTLNDIKDSGEELKATGKELRADQAEKASEKALCRAVLPQMGTAKSEISIGLNKLTEVQNSCNSNDERCLAIKALQSKFAEITGKASEIFLNINKINKNCDNASDNKPSEDFIKTLGIIDTQKTEILDLVAKLKAEQDKVGNVGNGIRIEAENEASTSLLPKTESWHSRKETNPSWRPPYYGTGVWYLSRGGESLIYNFQAPGSGEYSLWVRDYVDNFQAVGVRRVTYAINGKIFGTYPEVVLPKSKIDPQKGGFGWHNIGKVKLSAGQNTMKTTKESTTSGAAILDAFYLTTGTETPTEK